ncbi:MAG TPA: hypothetical protein PLG17_10785, partial [Thermodesulfobacteriota bacterium]|nr:hypothetical protein [Thermodesulfobacteriota bacterium]
INLGLENAALYEGCVVKEVGGRLSLMTPPEEAVNIVGRNVKKLIDAAGDRSAVTLTGPMAVWAYLVVFHQVVHRFSAVFYDDGRSGAVQIAQH